ncbi:MAG: DHH family phosphoesterase [Clostridia bacterium]|nr:DHH family phosphoesterase [Clostridia bacterium]
MKNKSEKKPNIVIFLCVSAALSIAYAAVTVIHAARNSGGNILSGVIFYSVVYILALAAAVLIWRALCIKHGVGLTGETGDITITASGPGMLSEIDFPALICNGDQKIVWLNRAFSDNIGPRKLYGKPFSSICGAGIADILECTEPGGFAISLEERDYTVKAYTVAAEKGDYTLTLWRDVTELNEAKKLLDSENTVAAYIVVDNLDELMQFVSEKYRTVSGDIESVIKEWSDSVNGIVKEYERDKYIFFFSNEHLKTFIGNKFSILDKIREIRVSEANMPVTVSIGIAGIKGTLAEKEAAAHAALDTALQRGGDQVVVRTEKGYEYYGGLVQTVQRRTKVKARVVATELAMLISQSSNVLIMPHVHPDFDAIGACIGLIRLSKFCGVKAKIIAEQDDPVIVRCFDTLEDIGEYDIEDDVVDPAEAQELLESDTLLIITDVNNRSQYTSPETADNAHRLAIIDHHRKAADFSYEPILSYIEPAASSACELIAELLEQSLPAGTLKREECNLLLSGIMLDTKQFVRNSGSRTFGAAQYLRNEGGNPTAASELFKTDIGELQEEARYESDVIIYKNKIAIAQNKSHGANRVAAAKAADRLLTVRGIAASFVICESNGTVHISARSAGKINVQLILEKLGGGGHFEAAAAQIRNAPVSEVLVELKKAIDEYLEKN